MSAEIKFCGLTRAEDAAYAASLGAAYVGVIFAGGPRMLTAERAANVLAGAPSTVKRVGVFADQGADEIARIADSAHLDVVQLHGASNAERISGIRAHFGGTIWPVCRISGATIPDTIQDLIASGDGVLLDALVPGGLGGTGIALPWVDIARDIASISASGKLVVLAGGLRAENVARAIAALDPDVVDVSSGVERARASKITTECARFATQF